MTPRMRMILLAVAAALVAANVALMPDWQHAAALPPAPPTRFAAATALDWRMLGATRVDLANPQRSEFAKELRALDGRPVRLFGYVSLVAVGTHAQHVTACVISPGDHFLCCGPGAAAARNPAGQLLPATTVLVEHEAQPWRPPENPGVFAEVAGTLRLGARDDDERDHFLYRLEDSRLAFYRLTAEGTWALDDDAE